ncbi:MAG: glycosyltransferase family 2 protein [Solirubrobacteraceae bacterium]
MDAVMVTHNSEADVRALIGSQPTMNAFERIVVVDNASADHTVALASDVGFEVAPQPSNLGFAAAANLGVGMTRGPRFALLNPDVRFQHPGDLARLERHFDDPGIGGVAPALVLPSGEMQDSARRVPSPSDLLVRRFTRLRPDAIRASRPVDVEWAAGACLLLRRSMYDEIGGLDVRFFLYFEDVDLGIRVREAGFRIRYDPEVRVFHAHHAASRANLLMPATRHHLRSAVRFYARHPGFISPPMLRRGSAD